MGVAFNGGVFGIDTATNDIQIWKDLAAEHTPTGSLIHSGGKLWGVTQFGGEGSGVIFTLDTDGSNYQVVHKFQKLSGKSPLGALLDVGGVLWGTTNEGGENGVGLVFSIKNDGSDFMVHHNFDGIEGSGPIGALTFANSKIWGTSNYGGSYGGGTIFNIETDGTGFATVHHFGLNTDGRNPPVALTHASSKIWGMTTNGGSSGSGTIFSLNEDGTGYSIEHNFTQNLTISAGQLLEHGGKLWGTTSNGGANIWYGVVFSINTDGSGYTTVYDFDLTSGAYPKAGLVISNNRFWGHTNGGGSSSKGVVFSLALDGSDYQVEHTFTGSDGDFSDSKKLLVDGNKLWGLRTYGGTSMEGTVFSIDNDGTNFTKAHDFGSSDGIAPSSSILKVGNMYWGASISGAANGGGSIFFMEENGGNWTKVHDFDYSSPVLLGDLVYSNQKIWGMTKSIGSNFGGQIFHIDTDGQNYSVVHEFSSTDGVNPEDGLIESNGKLWGVTRSNGGDFRGTLFSIDTSGTNFTKHVDFSRDNTSRPVGNLLESQGKLWGLTYGLGDARSGNGIIYKIDTTGENFTIIHEFDSINGLGALGSLIEVEDKFWGTTFQGGVNDVGVIFTLDNDGTNFTKMHDFDTINGWGPRGSLLHLGDRLYGITSNGGIHNDGVIFSIKTDETGFKKELDLTGLVGNPSGSLKLVKVLTDQDLSFTISDDKVYGNNPFTLSATSNTSTPIEYSSSNAEVISVSGTDATIHSAGTVTITANQAQTTEYFEASIDQTITVTKKPITLQSSQQFKVYGDEDPVVDLSSYNSLLVEGDSLTGSPSREVGEDVGAYLTTIGSISAGSNYLISFVSDTFFITARPLSITAESKVKIYGASDPELTYTISSGGLVGNETITGALSRETGEDAGDYIILRNTLTAGKNYNLTYADSKFVISKAPLIASAVDVTTVEGETIPDLSITYVGFVSGEDETVLDSPPMAITEATASSLPGEYSIVFIEGSDNNYSFQYESGTLVINDRILGIPLNEMALELYPNPATNAIHVSGKSVYSIEIYSSAGKLLYAGTEFSLVDISDFKDVVYLVVGRDAVGSIVGIKKFIKSDY